MNSTTRGSPTGSIREVQMQVKSSKKTSNMTRLPEGELNTYQEAVVSIEVEQEVEEIDHTMEKGADPHGMNKIWKLSTINGMSHNIQTQDILKIEKMKKKEGLGEKMRGKQTHLERPQKYGEMYGQDIQSIEHTMKKQGEPK